MEKVLNRGLNFCVLPLKLDLTQVLVDFKQFERTIAWQEFWHNRDQSEQPRRRIFKNKKHNFPRKHTAPTGMKIFLGAVKSEIIDPKNRNEAKSNLPDDELKALKELIRLQRERVITIKPCDKGAGLMVQDFPEYLEVCQDHLSSNQNNNERKPFYKKVTEAALNEAKTEIKKVLQEAFDNEVISKDEFEQMDPENKKAGKFYCTPKVHKEHDASKPPPPRPIVSGCGSVTENIGLFAEHFLKEVSSSHDSYLKDTPDFLRTVELINNEGKLPENAILVTADVSSLYTNINHKDAIKTSRKALNSRSIKEVPTEFIVRLLELVMKYNIFEFNSELYQQLIGFAMGSRPAPNVANNFMAECIDKNILKISHQIKEGALKVLKRFLDDLFFIFTGTTIELHKLLSEMNQIHPDIKFTSTHTTPIENDCGCEVKQAVPFLDTLLTTKEGQIIVDLYKKPTDRNMYLLPNSCHPPTVTDNIPLACALRITRICSETSSRDTQHEKLKEFLLQRNYPVKMIERAINHAKSVPRSQLLKPVSRDTTTRRPVFVATWDPRLPSLSSILQKHWRSMIYMDPYLKEVFSEPPMVAFKRQKNIRDFLIRAKVPNKLESRPQRKIPGMKTCTKQCHLCPYILKGKTVKYNDQEWKLNKTFNCKTENIIYLIECEKCEMRYIGETERSLSERIGEHKTYIRTKKLNQPTGYHFNLPGHSLDQLKVTVLERVTKTSALYRKERESYFIRKFNTLNRGMNKAP